MTSKEYLTNSHILLKYFELVFLQLHLVEISCKLITIRLSYKRNKRLPFYETSCTVQPVIGVLATDAIALYCELK